MNVFNYSPQSQALQSIVKGFVIWESNESTTINKLILPSIDSGIGLTIKGSLKVKYNSVLQEAPKYGTRNISIPTNQIQLSNDFYNISVRLTPNGISKFTNADISKSYEDNFIELDKLINQSSLNLFTKSILSISDKSKQIKLFELFLLEHLRKSNSTLLDDCINQINKTSGNIKINELAKQFNTNERTLNRLFLSKTGMTPKSFSKKMRFRKLINLLSNDNQHLPLTEKILEAGFFDQSHAIKEFKETLGIIPTKFIKLDKDILSDFYNFKPL